MELERVSMEAISDPARLGALLAARRPFVVPGVPVPQNAYDTSVQAFRQKKIELWDQQNDFFRIFRERLECHEGDVCPCTEMSGVDTIASTEVDAEQDFQVVMRFIFPRSEVDRRLAQPVLRNLGALTGGFRQTNLFNTLFVSNGETRGILHAHNYDVLGFFLEVGEGSRLHLYPIEMFERLQSRCMPAMAGVVNFHNYQLEDGLEPGELEGVAIVHDLRPGDLVHIPFCWYHRVDHQGRYVHLATNWFLPDLVEARLAAVRPYIPADEWPVLQTHTRRLRQWILRAPAEHVVGLFNDRFQGLRGRLQTATGHLRTAISR